MEVTAASFHRLPYCTEYSDLVTIQLQEDNYESVTRAKHSVFTVKKLHRKFLYRYLTCKK